MRESLAELEAAYLEMTDRDRQVEITLAEEGLRVQPDLSGSLSGEVDWPWWE